MKRILPFAVLVTLLLGFNSCGSKSNKVRKMVDSLGFATKSYQVDSVLTRIARLQGDSLSSKKEFNNVRVAVCPHDDYAYVGWIYPATLRNIKAKTVILFGVAHKAKRFGLENKLIFESFDEWYAPAGDIKVSDYRSKLLANMPADMVEVHDSMHTVEHSLESMLPILQHFNPNLEIIPILVPYMSFERIQQISQALAGSMKKVFGEADLTWGKDYALLITTDAVHYGDADWGGKNYAPFGVDTAGYKKAVAHEHEVINTLTGTLTIPRVQKFYGYTVDSSDYREYKWTWCGRYSVPLGLCTAIELEKLTDAQNLVGIPVGYANSIDHPTLPVEDLGMGVTAPANIRHWVGYAAVVYP